jgi:hypothetical protein
VRSSARVSLCGAACSDIVTVSGAGATRQGTHMGTYLKVPGRVQDSRPVYEMGSTGDHLLYFSKTANIWYIGAGYKNNIVGLKSSTAAACPDQATGWLVQTGTAYVNTYPVKVQGARIVVAVVAIVVPAAAAAVLILILTYHHYDQHHGYDHCSYSCSFLFSFFFFFFKPTSELGALCESCASMLTHHDTLRAHAVMRGCTISA